MLPSVVDAAVKSTMEEVRKRNTQKQRRIDSLIKTRVSQVRLQLCHSCKKEFGVFAGVFVTPKKKEKFCLFIEDQLGPKIVEARLMTAEGLQDAIKRATEQFEKGHLIQEHLEQVLDLVFVELERKLSARPKPNK